VPADIPVFKLAQDLWICELMKQLRFATSTSEARRLLGQGAVRVDGQTITDSNFHFVPGEHKILEVGKRRVARIASIGRDNDGDSTSSVLTTEPTPGATLGKDATEFGNMTLIFKGLAYQSDRLAVSGGLSFGIPTAPDPGDGRVPGQLRR